MNNSDAVNIYFFYNIYMSYFIKNFNCISRGDVYNPY